MPLAIIEGTNVYALHPDHLGTPQAITDENQQIVWQADYEPFGQASVTTEFITNNLRFPGQYFDAETGLHQNSFRDYSPEIGRYITSDPIGLDGGINTYTYVNGNPITNTDPFGLFVYNWHYIFTANGAIQAGMKINEAQDLAYMTANVDLLPGSQDAENSQMHAMTPPGLNSYQAQSAFGEYLEEQLALCNLAGLAKALHAIQDSYAGGHRNFQPYNGLSSITFSHVRNDFVPDNDTQTAATVATQNAVSLFNKKCKECN